MNINQAIEKNADQDQSMPSHMLASSKNSKKMKLELFGN